jgi:hypothetical protein
MYRFPILARVARVLAKIHVALTQALIRTQARTLSKSKQGPVNTNNSKKLDTLLDLSVSSLRRGHANLLCIVPILTDDPRRESNNFGITQGNEKMVCADGHTECGGSLSTNEVQRHWALLVLGWGNTWEDLGAWSAFALLMMDSAKSSRPQLPWLLWDQKLAKFHSMAKIFT